MPDYGLTPLQLELMAVLWERGEATVVEVQKSLRPDRDLALTTVATLLSRLAKKGLATHRTDGRVYVYRAAVEESQVKRSMVSEFTELASRLFAGDVAELVTQLLSERDVDAADLAKVRAMIERREAELKGGVS